MLLTLYTNFPLMSYLVKYFDMHMLLWSFKFILPTALTDDSFLYTYLISVNCWQFCLFLCR